VTKDIRKEIEELKVQLAAHDFARHQMAKKLKALELDLTNGSSAATPAAICEVTG